MAKVSRYSLGKWMLCGLLFLVADRAGAQFSLRLEGVDKDTVFLTRDLGISTRFPSRLACMDYINKLPAYLQTKGYSTASIDSLWLDSSYAFVKLYVGEAYKLSYIDTRTVDKKVLEQAGWNEKSFFNKPFNPGQTRQLQERLLDYYENNGYPFAKIQLDSFRIEKEQLSAQLKIDRGPFYRIDSIRMYGEGKISNVFMQRYLDIKNGSPYQKEKLKNINQRLLELPYLQQQEPWTLTMLGTGSVLNLYLKPKKSSLINVLLGFLPASSSTTANNGYDQVRTKLLFTGEATIKLNNALGNGELIGLNWQQLQQSSPKLNLQYQQPYLWGSPFGISTSFDLYKKDSSYLNLEFQAGMQYSLSTNQTGKVFFQSLRTNLLFVDTLALMAAKKLPDQIDLSTASLGVDYQLYKTNYRPNPRRGYELQLTVSAGTRQIRKNNVIAKLVDPVTKYAYASLYDSIQLHTYQFKIKAVLAKYFQISRQSTIKTAFSGGWFQSPGIFRNELFQIGGNRLMRGFDEESIYASQYGVATLEYRYLVGLNSYFFVFTDGGYAENKSINIHSSNTFFGMGLGMAFETKAGIFNISFAAGKRNDVPLDLRQSKIHLGYLTYF